MKMLANVLVVIGVISLAVAVFGRFYGEPTIQGYQAVNVMIAANSVLLLAVICKLTAK